MSKFACQAANQTLNFLLGLPLSGSLNNGLFLSKIDKVEYSLYRQVSHPSPVMVCPLLTWYKYQTWILWPLTISIFFFWPRVQLFTRLTSSQVKNDIKNFFREGFVLRIYLDNATVGLGEVCNDSSFFYLYLFLFIGSRKMHDKNSCWLQLLDARNPPMNKHMVSALCLSDFQYSYLYTLFLMLFKAENMMHNDVKVKPHYYTIAIIWSCKLQE